MKHYTHWLIVILTCLWNRSISYRNQSIESMEWFLHDRDLRHERIKLPSSYNECNFSSCSQFFVISLYMIYIYIYIYIYVCITAIIFVFQYYSLWFVILSKFFNVSCQNREGKQLYSMDFNSAVQDACITLL